jgi:hypothetical protein
MKGEEKHNLSDGLLNSHFFLFERSKIREAYTKWHQIVKEENIKIMKSLNINKKTQICNEFITWQKKNSCDFKPQ